LIFNISDCSFKKFHEFRGLLALQFFDDVDVF
jgi:hypothetical protein